MWWATTLDTLTWNSNGRFKINFLYSRLHDGDESSPLPSPPPVPSSKSEKRVTCNATNNTGWLNCNIKLLEETTETTYLLRTRY